MAEPDLCKLCRRMERKIKALQKFQATLTSSNSEKKHRSAEIQTIRLTRTIEFLKLQMVTDSGHRQKQCFRQTQEKQFPTSTNFGLAFGATNS